MTENNKLKLGLIHRAVRYYSSVLLMQFYTWYLSNKGIMVTIYCLTIWLKCIKCMYYLCTARSVSNSNFKLHIHHWKTNESVLNRCCLMVGFYSFHTHDKKWWNQGQREGQLSDLDFMISYYVYSSMKLFIDKILSPLRLLSYYFC